ncbi:MAG: helix-turn-helix domain-containing protein [Pseudonocardiaceae bacterium]
MGTVALLSFDVIRACVGRGCLSATLRWEDGPSPPGRIVVSDLEGMTTGQRVRHFRERVGMSRPVLGGLIGRSAEWVKAVENDRLLTPRIPLLLRLAEVLKVDDLGLLIGEQKRTAVAHIALSRRATT